MKVLMIDVGGTSVKLMVSGRADHRQFSSGRGLTPAKMIQGVLANTGDWDFEVVTFGYPGIVRSGRIAAEPHNLARGWLDFDFEHALGRPTRIINDAAMQALASYKSGRFLFLGLGTSVGTTLIADDTVVPLELGMIPISRSEVFFERLGRDGLNSHGRQRWQKSVERAVHLLQDIFWPDHFQIGGGNAKYLDPVPAGCVGGSNQDALRGAERLWPGADMLAEIHTTTLRIIRPVPAPSNEDWTPVSTG